MKRDYLGDSYDAVKRLWQQTLLQWAPLLAESSFIPADLRSEFTHLTRVPMLTAHVTGVHSILNDPDTGIPSPLSSRIRPNRTHAPLSFIAEQLARRGVRCVITFDQSHRREPGSSPQEQRAAKLRWLRAAGHDAFYYVSHAPFLFACSSSNTLSEVASLLLDAGIPKNRLQRLAT